MNETIKQVRTQLHYFCDINNNDDNSYPCHFLLYLAELLIEIYCQYKQTLYFCQDYRYESGSPCRSIAISRHEIESYLLRKPSVDIPAYARDENLCITYIGELVENELLLTKICKLALEFNIILTHGAAISLDNQCYIFTAPPGTGKTTHILNWKKVFPETKIINGDKPLINTEKKIVYGTPWCGKEGYNMNTSAPLAGIIELERGEQNSIRPIAFREMLLALLQQTFIPKERDLALKAYRLIDNLKDIPCYKLTCNMNEDSARVAYKGLRS